MGQKFCHYPYEQGRIKAVVPNRWVATPKWVAEEFLWGREQLPQ